MGKGVSISVAAETSDVERGLKTGVIAPLEDAADTLKDLAKEGDKAGGKLEASMRDAQKDTEKLGDEYQELSRTIRNTSKRGGQDLKEHTSDATDAAKRDLAELKDEALQNASETFSSFDGSMESFADGIQGTFGGIVSNMGPMGAILGSALAIGIGVAVAKGEELAEAVNSAKERAAELAAEISDVDGDLSQIQWVDKVKEWGYAIDDSREWFEFWQDDAKTAFETSKDYADRFGLSVKDLSLGLSGVDAGKATASVKALKEQVKGLEDQRGRAAGTSEVEKISSEIRARETLITKLEQQGGVTEEAIELTRMQAEITEELAAKDRAAAAATQARTDAANALQAELDAGVASWQNYINAESGATDPAAYVNAMADKASATANFNGNVQGLASEFRLSHDETQAILDQGLEFAPMLQSIIDSGLGPAFVEQLRAAAGGGQEILDGTPLGATVTAEADTGTAQADLDQAAADRDATVSVTADTKAAASQIDAAADKKRDAKVTAKAETTAANRDLDALASKSRTASIKAAVDVSAAETALINFVNRRRDLTIVANVVDRAGKPVP